MSTEHWISYAIGTLIALGLRDVAVYAYRKWRKRGEQG